MPRDGDGHSSGAPVAERLMRPTRAAARRLARHHRIAPRCLPLLLGLAPGGVFPAAAVAGGAVRSYRTVSPLPPDRHAGDGPAVYFLWHFPWGRPRRALPGTAPPWSPDFPLPAHRRKAAIRPSGTQDLGCRGAPVKACAGGRPEHAGDEHERDEGDAPMAGRAGCGLEPPIADEFQRRRNGKLKEHLSY